MIRRPPRSTLSSSSAASDVYKRQKQYTYQVLDGFSFVIGLNLIILHKEVIHVFCRTQQVLAPAVRNHKILDLQADDLFLPFKGFSVNVFPVTEFPKFGCRNPQFISPDMSKGNI